MPKDTSGELVEPVMQAKVADLQALNTEGLPQPENALHLQTHEQNDCAFVQQSPPTSVEGLNPLKLHDMQIVTSEPCFPLIQVAETGDLPWRQLKTFDKLKEERDMQN
eukprot:c1104_g2_i1 orf=1-321(-)